jgi:hypothetical protein
MEMMVSSRYRLIFYIVLLFLIHACTETKRGFLYEEDKIFIDVTESARLNYLKDSYSHCWGDINGDGLLDIYVINHIQSPELFINNGDGTFKNDIHSKVRKGGDLHGCAIGDYDNDGDQDIYVTEGAQRGRGVGSNRLYQNNGEGKFIDVALEAGITDPKGRGRSASWVDYNNDGYLDLFVANFMRDDAPSVLFRNNGNGTFSDVSVESGLNIIDDVSEASWCDYDNDGFMDLTVIKGRKYRKNEITIYKNLQNGTFKKTKTFYGWTYVWGDYDNDGDLDIFISVPPRTYVKIYKRAFEFSPLAHIFRGFNKLYENMGNGQFIDVSEKAGFKNKKGGDKVIFFDYDNDGYLDIYLLVSGTKNKNINDMIFKNNGNKTFTNITKEIAMIQNFSGRGYGVAYGDYNNDGLLDLFLTNGGNRWMYDRGKDSGPYILYENRASDNHWLKIKLIGTKSNRDGIGARVILYLKNQLLYRHNNGGMEGYIQNSSIIHFGLGDAPNIKRIEVIWPSGYISSMANVNLDQTIIIKEKE